MSIITDVLQGIGAAASGPAGAAGGVADLVKGIIDRVSPDPAQAAAQKLAVEQLEQAGQFKLIDAALASQQSDDKVLIAQQATMAAEAVGSGWLEKNWHALGSLLAIALVAMVYVAIPLLGRTVPSVPESAWLMLGGILGIATFKKGDVDISNAKSS